MKPHKVMGQDCFTKTQVLEHVQKELGLNSTFAHKEFNAAFDKKYPP